MSNGSYIIIFTFIIILTSIFVLPDIDELTISGAKWLISSYGILDWNETLGNLTYFHTGNDLNCSNVVNSSSDLCTITDTTCKVAGECDTVAYLNESAYFDNITYVDKICLNAGCTSFIKWNGTHTLIQT